MFTFCRSGCLAVILAGSILAVAGPASAGIISTPESASGQPAPSARERVDSILAREDVARVLQAQGVSAQDARQRLAGLNDAEVEVLARRIDALPAGGFMQSFTDQQIIIVLLAVILLVLLL